MPDPAELFISQIQESIRLYRELKNYRDAFSFKNFDLTPLDEDNLWLSNKSGEGMQMPKKHLEKILKDYFTEKF